jgi:hypothetical protein
MRSFWGQQGWDARRVVATSYDDADLVGKGVSGLYCVLWSTSKDGALRTNECFPGDQVRGDVCVKIELDDDGGVRFVDVEEDVLNVGLWKGC